MFDDPIVDALRETPAAPSDGVRAMKVGFVLLSPSADPIPSTRVAVLNVMPALRDAGVDARIVVDPLKAEERAQLSVDADRLVADGYDVVCFQKVNGPSVLALVGALRARGIKTVYVVCDLVDNEMARAVDAVVVVTGFLRSLYAPELQRKIVVIHDGIERPDVRKSAWRSDAGSRRRPLEAVLVTSASLDRLPVIRVPPSWLRVTVVGRFAAGRSRWSALRDVQYRIRTQPSWRARLDAALFAGSSRIRCIPWHPDGVYERMKAADIGIIPVDIDEAPPPGESIPYAMVKSENRLTMKMAIGLPVVASPIPSYLPVVENGVNAFLASGAREWIDRLGELRDPRVRKRIGESARNSVIQNYSIEAQVELWIKLLTRLSTS